MNRILSSSLIGTLCLSCTSSRNFKVDTALSYCINQVDSTLNVLETYDAIPRNISNDAPTKAWKCTSVHDWTSGFWPGILWYAYEYTQDKRLLAESEAFFTAQYPDLDREVATPC